VGFRVLVILWHYYDLQITPKKSKLNKIAQVLKKLKK